MTCSFGVKQQSLTLTEIIRIYSIINHKMESYNMGKCRSKKRPEEQRAMHFKNDKTYLILNYLLCKSYKCLFELTIFSMEFKVYIKETRLDYVYGA